MSGNHHVICDFWEEKFATFLKHGAVLKICVESV